MAQIIEDRVRETTTTSGTGAITTTGAVLGFRSFSSVCSVGDTVYCCVVAVDANGIPTGQWEVGNYTYSAANTLSRTTILSSSNNNLTVNFSAGTKHIFLDLPAYQIKQFAVASPTPSPPPPGPSPTPSPPGSVWPVGQDSSLFNAISFQDEFNGTTLDTSKWSDTIWYERGQSFPQNYSVSNSCLNIWPQVDPNRVNNGNNGFYNRAFASDGKWSQQFGYFEARIKMPIGKGLFPAFWLFNHQRTEGVIHTEIDIMECYTSADVNSLPGWSTSDFHPVDYVMTVHNNQITGDIPGSWRAMEGGFVPRVDISQAFHVYGALWDSTGVRFYYDGIPIGSKIMTNQTNFNVRPMYFILDLWYNGQSGVPNASQTPQGPTNAMQFDYVRAWPLKNP